MTIAPVEDDAAWAEWKSHWTLRGDTTYLNHGSFGPSPRVVTQAQHTWQRRLEEQPMDFYLRQFEDAWYAARDRLGAFLGAAAERLVFAENATAAMNVVADSFPLQGDDEVLLTNHEYEAVRRIWTRKCRQAGAREPVIATLPQGPVSEQSVLDALTEKISPRTRLLVVSHITSPTALILPVEAICEEVRRRGIAVCVDGPHAIAQLPLEIDRLGCDFYTASCHKWLCAPFGSGLLYAAPRWHETMQQPMLSWGRLPPTEPQRWDDEFVWCGTRDPSAYLAVPAAIDFLQQVGLEAFRARTHYLADYARRRLLEQFPGPAEAVGDTEWFGSMVNVPLPAVDTRALQRTLWSEHGIEIPIVSWNEQASIRVSCHLYNDRRDIDHLIEALRERLPSP